MSQSHSPLYPFVQQKEPGKRKEVRGRARKHTLRRDHVPLFRPSERKVKLTAAGGLHGATHSTHGKTCEQIQVFPLCLRIFPHFAMPFTTDAHCQSWGHVMTREGEAANWGEWRQSPRMVGILAGSYGSLAPKTFKAVY